MKKLSVVGIGPGKYEGLTLEAENALKEAEIIVGYTAYVDLVKPHFPEKEYYATGMMGEVERCKAALDFAKEKRVAVICSGDSTVYGMATLIYELSENYEGAEIEVIAGVTAASSGSALLGAPLAHDFAVISMSDLLTPLPLIYKRLELAAQGDFCIAIYNPASRKRADYLKNACEVLLNTLSPNTVCGVARRIGREGESVEITTLDKLGEVDVDMFTTVFIGNSQTRVIDGKMVTPRGYKDKYEM
ncbi:MAG: precorrin-3B C(17)-methyltransferase [Bacillota bacterium]|nr:precorrin-3B C(17)-methyltransferase [Bacillota bacterium]